MTSRFFPRLLLSLTALAAPLLLSACAAPVDDETVAQNPPPQYVQEAPPAPEPELIPMIMDPQHEIWRPGYWAMVGGTFSWVEGKVISRPDPTAVWAGAHWTHHTYGWSFEQGHWQ